MKTLIKKIIPIITLSGVGIMLAGCKTVVRENIISAIDTGIGATLAENKQTQMYELKAGYIHSQFYSIPTGKVVENEDVDDDAKKTTETVVTDKAGNKKTTTIKEDIVASLPKQKKADRRSNRADITPQVVSGIRAKTSLADIVLGMEVSESFAVGDVAVMSPAATAMYIANAKDPATAQAAASAVSEAAVSDVIEGNQSAATLAKATDDGTGKVSQDKLDKLVKGTLLEGKVGKYYGASTDSLKAKLMGSWRPYIPQMNGNNK